VESFGDCGRWNLGNITTKGFYAPPELDIYDLVLLELTPSEPVLLEAVKSSRRALCDQLSVAVKRLFFHKNSLTKEIQNQFLLREKSISDKEMLEGEIEQKKKWEKYFLDKPRLDKGLLRQFNKLVPENLFGDNYRGGQAFLDLAFKVMLRNAKNQLDLLDQSRRAIEILNKEIIAQAILDKKN
jgi:hypothetical protein